MLLLLYVNINNNLINHVSLQKLAQGKKTKSYFLSAGGAPPTFPWIAQSRNTMFPTRLQFKHSSLLLSFCLCHHHDFLISPIYLCFQRGQKSITVWQVAIPSDTAALLTQGRMGGYIPERTYIHRARCGMRNQHNRTKKGENSDLVSFSSSRVASP